MVDVFPKFDILPQILSIHDYLLSFVQIRGSIPMDWNQYGKSLTPTVRINPDRDANVKNHFSILS